MGLLLPGSDSRLPHRLNEWESRLRPHGEAHFLLFLSLSPGSSWGVLAFHGSKWMSRGAATGFQNRSIYNRSLVASCSQTSVSFWLSVARPDSNPESSSLGVPRRRRCSLGFLNRQALAWTSAGSWMQSAPSQRDSVSACSGARTTALSPCLGETAHPVCAADIPPPRCWRAASLPCARPGALSTKRGAWFSAAVVLASPPWRLARLCPAQCVLQALLHPSVLLS